MGYSLQLYVVCAFAAIGGFCFGYDSGIISGSYFLQYQRYSMDVSKRYIGIFEILEYF